MGSLISQRRNIHDNNKMIMKLLPCNMKRFPSEIKLTDADNHQQQPNTVNHVLAIIVINRYTDIDSGGVNRDGRHY